MLSFIIVPILPIILLRKKDDVQLPKKYIIIVILVIFIVFIFNCDYANKYDKYKVNGNKVYGTAFRIIGDLITNQTIEVNTDKVKVVQDTIYLGYYRKSSNMRNIEKVYYLDTDNGKYVIPVININVVRSLLYTYSYGENTNNQIILYKNSKLIKSINGVELSDNEAIKKFLNNKYYIVSLYVQPDKKIKCEAVGCTVEEFISNNKYIWLCVLNDKEEIIKIINIKNELPVNLPTDLKDGKYEVCFCKYYGSKLERESNSIKFTIKNGIITEIQQKE